MTILDFLANNPIFFIGICTIVGLLVGSFLNVVIYRLPVMMEKDWTAQCETLLAPDSSQAETANTSDLKEDHFSLAYPPSRCPKCSAKIKAWQNIPVLSWLLLKGKCAGCRTAISVRYPIIEAVTGILSGYVA
jgi:leader peptidase (prepilin peptidase)/N-methyltransferase